MNLCNVNPKKAIKITVIVLCIVFIIHDLWFPDIWCDYYKDIICDNKAAYDEVAKICFYRHVQMNSEKSVCVVNNSNEENKQIYIYSRSYDNITGNGEYIQLSDKQFEYLETVKKTYHLDGDYLLQIEVYNHCVFFCNMNRRAYFVYSINGKRPSFLFFSGKTYYDLKIKKIADNWFFVEPPAGFLVGRGIVS